MDWLKAWQAVLVALIGAGLSLYSVQLLALAVRSRSWPVVEGCIKPRGAGEGSDLYRVRASVRYVYRVEGQEYEASTISHAPFDWQAAALMEKYAQRKEVPVYYDPTNPARAVLEPGASRLHLYALLFSIGLLGAGVSLFATM